MVLHNTHIDLPYPILREANSRQNDLASVSVLFNRPSPDPGVTGSEAFLDHRFKNTVLDMEQQLLLDEKPGDDTIRLMYQAHNGKPGALSEFSTQINTSGESATTIATLLHRSWSGNPESIFILGSLYARGIGVEFNPQRALKLFQLAEQKGLSVPNAYFVHLRCEQQPGDE